MLHVDISLALPYTLTAVTTLLLILAAVLLLWAPSRASAYEAETRLDTGAHVALAHLPLLGRGVLSSRTGHVIVAARILAAAALLAIPLGIRAGENDVVGVKEEMMRYGRRGNTVSVSDGIMMVAKVTAVCRRNVGGRSVLYEMLDPLSATGPESFASVERRAFCAEPGVVDDVREVYSNSADAGDVAVPIPGVLPAMTEKNVVKAKVKGEEVSVRSWGSLEDGASPGALACVEASEGVGEGGCVFAGGASGGRRAVSVQRGVESVERSEDVSLESGFEWEALNFTGLDDNALGRGLVRLLALEKAEKATRATGFDEALLMLDLIRVQSGSEVRRILGTKEVTMFDVWAAGVLVVLCAAAVALSVFFAISTGQKTRLNDFSWCMREVVKTGEVADPTTGGKKVRGENVSLLFISGGDAGDKYISRRAYDVEGSRRFTGVSSGEFSDFSD